MPRKKKSHNKKVESKTFIHNKPCVCCQKKLTRVSSSDRYLSTQKERIRAFVEVYECQNPKCHLYGQKIRPSTLTNLIFPGLSYGLDIIAEMGTLRFKEQKSIPQIHEFISKKYSHVEITERHTENIIKKFMLVIEAAGENPKITKKRLFGKKKNLKGLVVSVDGIQPEQGNDILYVVREIQSGEMLFAKYLEFSDAETMRKEIFEPIKILSEKMKLPVFGFIVDKQQVFTQVIEELFPGVPIQHCQSHFLKDLRKPVREKDSEMAKSVKKNSGDYGKSNEKLKKKRTNKKRKF